MEELTASHWEELTEKELEDIIKFSEEVEEEEEEQGNEEEEKEARPNLAVKFLTEVLQDMWAVTDGLKSPTSS